MQAVVKDGRVVSLGSFTPTMPDHPVYPVVSIDEVLSGDIEEILDRLLKREELIRLEKEDPYRYGYEPSGWRLCDLLMDWPWLSPEDKVLGRKLRLKLGLTAARLRSLLMNGGNRAGKTEYCAKAVMKLLQHKPNARAWVFHSTRAMSVEYHHAKLWEMLPAEQRRKEISQIEYVSYSKQNGFAGDKFTLKNGSSCTFRNYEQNAETLEGAEVDIIWADELLPAEWLKTLEARVATRGGCVLISFTPVKGYTPMVASFREGAAVAHKETAWLIPRDASIKPDYTRATIVRDLVAEVLNPPAPHPDYKEVPRVERCPDPRHAVVFFHTGDNLHGNPREIFDINVPAGEVSVLERCYGVAQKAMRVRFALNDAVHVVPPEAVPTTGTNHMACDPSSARNWFKLWGRVSRDSVYIYREWPNMVEPVEGHGLLGPWAEYDGKKPDGKKGPGQDSLDFGLLDYKKLIARLEGWKDAERKGDGSYAGGPDATLWTPVNGAREVVDRRIIDSRFATAPRLERDIPKTLISEMDEVGVFFETASGATIETGCELIKTALAYDRSKPLGFMNRPKLYVSSDCRNLIHALKTWTGHDGNEGATKDPIDVLRYFFTADLTDTARVVEALAGGEEEPDNFY